MFLCCCVRLHRHQLHLASYGFVSMSLIVTGFVFTVFAVFHRDSPPPIEPTGPAQSGQQNDRPSTWDWVGRSRLGKIWLAGPVLMVVGAVLCGKVMIDWGPAMSRGRTGSLDSQLVDELVFSNLLPIGDAKARVSLITTAEPSKVMTTMAHCSRTSVASSSTDRFLLPQSADTGAVVGLPNHHKLSCPLSPPPPPFCAFYGSSSSASSIASQKAALLTASDSGAFHFDRIIYGPTDQLLDQGDEEEERGNSGKIGMIAYKLDKSTQSERDGAEGCERCATFWPILEANSKRNSGRRVNRPKVIGKFVFAELLEKAGRKSPNYGTILTGNDDQQLGNDGMMLDTYPEQLQYNKMTGSRSQGETLIMNERSFLI